MRHAVVVEHDTAARENGVIDSLIFDRLHLDLRFGDLLGTEPHFAGGCLRPRLLPRERGAAPGQATYDRRERQSGACTKPTDVVRHGPIQRIRQSHQKIVN